MSDRATHLKSRLPSYLRIAQLLRERIVSGAYLSGEFLPPERELAEELKASRQTVRLAIEELRREGAVVTEHGRGTRITGPEFAGEILENSDQFQLAALVIYGMSREGSAAIFQGCQAAMQREDHHLIVCETAHDTIERAANEAAHLRALIDKGIRGLVIYAEPTDQNRALIQEAVDKGIQVVQIDRYLPGLDCDYVGVDNRTAAREMTDHLWSLGHRRIGFISMQPEPTSCEERRQGYLAALNASSPRPSGSELVAYLSTHQPPQSELRQIVRTFRALPEPPTALFVNNDGLASLLMRALREQEIQVPEELAVVGFDNQHIAGLLSPPLTTVQQPFQSMGETAGQLLLDRMAGRYHGVSRRVLLSTRLVVRQSCGSQRGMPALAAVAG